MAKNIYILYEKRGKEIIPYTMYMKKTTAEQTIKFNKKYDPKGVYKIKTVRLG